ncbi:MAG: allophanate hydrolase [Halieaceae bacterium]|nr:allophanate hydrolase [Halieaceae bacterium]
MKLDIGSIRQFYLSGGTPQEVVTKIKERITEHADNPVWIYCLQDAEIASYLERLNGLDQQQYPLWGVPFAIKDNIDLAGVPTTAACPAFAYVPEQSAFVVQALINAGAIPIGKTNLDQFATGLNGTRSPYGAVQNSVNKDYISGGSSSGSAVAVALDMVSFALGTDTAGSGRVPAAFNNLVGLKPSLGLVSTSGVVPACRSLDCVTIFAKDLDTASTAFNVMDSFDAQDPFAHANVDANSARTEGVRQGLLKLGVIRPDQLKFFGDAGYQAAYEAALEEIQLDAGVELVEIDFEPFSQAASLLYSGPWVAERTLACRDPLSSYPDEINSVVRGIIKGGSDLTAIQCFEAQYQLKALKRVCDAGLADVDAMLTPTAGRLYTLAELEAEPIQYNTNLGYYTNYMNLLDYAGLAIPAGFTSQALPFGLTLVGPRCSDRALLSIARRLSHDTSPGSQRAVADSRYLDILVCGAHMDGLPLNHQLLDRGGALLEAARTAPAYRLLALPGEGVKRPALVGDSESGISIGAEVWRLPIETVGSFLEGIPAPLGLGAVTLADGREVKGFIAAAGRVDSAARDVSDFGDWRAYLASL